MRNRTFLIITLLACLACLLPSCAWALPIVTTDNMTAERKFRVCMLLMESQKNTVGGTSYSYWNHDPWFLPVLIHSPLLPAGWELYNPMAPSYLPANPTPTATPGSEYLDQDLWSSGDGYAKDSKGQVNRNNWYTNSRHWGTAPNNQLLPGVSPVTKDDPAYWAVKLNENSLDALVHFDLLIINGMGASTLSNRERDMLRFLLERGATIWINNSQRDGLQVYNFFLDPEVEFNSGPYGANPTARLKKTDQDHWLMTAVYRLSDNEVQFLRDKFTDGNYIKEGVADSATSTSLIREVVRLQQSTGGLEPAIAAGRVGNGQLILTATDIMGGVSDWWEYQHNGNRFNTGASLTDPTDPDSMPDPLTPTHPNAHTMLNTWPYQRGMDPHANLGGGLPDKHDVYPACCKLVFNLLARPANWHMVGGNVTATRAYDNTFAASLGRGWTDTFNALGDPVSYGDYVAVTGNTLTDTTANAAQFATELRVYRTRRVSDEHGSPLDYPYGLYDEDGALLSPATSSAVRPAWWRSAYRGTLTPWYTEDVTAGSEMDLCFVRTSSHWVGSPVFGTQTVSVDGKVVTRTVLYALKSSYDSVNDKWNYYPVCIPLDPYITTPTADAPQVGDDKWRNLSFADFNNHIGLPRASMTLSNNRLVVTTFGKTTDDSPWRIDIIDTRSGDVRAGVGGSPAWNAHFRPSGPATLVTAQVEFEASDMETGAKHTAITTSNYNPYSPQLRRDTVEVLAVAGEYYSATAPTAAQPAVFLIPPTFSVKLTPPREVLSRVPGDMRLIEGTTPEETDKNPQPHLVHVIGNPGSEFRQKQLLMLKAGGGMLKLTFRNWDVFLPQDPNNPQWNQDTNSLTWPLTVAYTPERSSTNVTPGVPQGPVYLKNLYLDMGYPLLLQGTQRVDLGARPTLRLIDGTDPSNYGHLVDAPPLVFRDQMVVGTSTATDTAYPALTNSAAVPRAISQYRGGMLGGVRLKHYSLSELRSPGTNPLQAEHAWQFHGDTHGPSDLAEQQYYWRSNFPYPPAVSGDTIFTTAAYHGRGDALGTPESYRPLSMTDFSNPFTRYRGTLYAVDPDTSRYLCQTVTVGNVQDAGMFGYLDPGQRVRFRITQQAPPPDAGYTSQEYRYEVRIAENPGEFEWRAERRQYNATAGWTAWQEAQAWTAPQVITFGEQLLMNGVYVRFANTTFSTGELWSTDQAQYQLCIRATEVGREGALRVGGRALLKVNYPLDALQSYTWDLGTITGIRQDLDFAANGCYWLTFSRPRREDAQLLQDFVSAENMAVLVATSVPHVSHVQGWAAITGAEPIRTYNNGSAIRLSEGFCGAVSSDEAVNPDRRLKSLPQEVMIGFDPTTDLPYTCHESTTLDAARPGSDPIAIVDQPNFLPTAWANLDHYYIPRASTTQFTNEASRIIDFNFVVDYRLGRIELNPQYAGEFADRFVVVHYRTHERVGATAPQNVHHAEIMYVPSQIKWAYHFPDAIPDSGPVVAGNLVYVSAWQLTAGNYWQPVLYAFDAQPQSPLDVQPLWVQRLDTRIDGAAPLPYRGVTSPIPTAAGLLLGAALKGSSTNQLALFTDRGTLIADGHRLLRIDADGQVTWQATATRNYDPAALRSSNALSRSIGITQQDFTLINRLHRLNNGNLLLCDTGGNRVLEMARDGQVVWQYPDGDLTYIDPDFTVTGTPLRDQDTLNTVIRKPTEKAYRLNGPRDVRRYYAPDVTVSSIYWSGIDFGAATIRWETTLIADTGNNRIIEVYRPLVRLDTLDDPASPLNANYTLARGFHYRPDMTWYLDGPALRESVRILADSRVLLDNQPLTQPLQYVAAARYPGPDNRIIATQPELDPVWKDVQTRELLVAVGNPAVDPYNPGSYLRTLRLSVPRLVAPADIRNYASLTAAAAGGATVVTVDDTSEFSIGQAVYIVAAGNPNDWQELGTITWIDAANSRIMVEKALKAGGFAANSRLFSSSVRQRIPSEGSRVITQRLVTLMADVVLADQVLSVDSIADLQVGQRVEINNVRLNRKESLGYITAIDPVNRRITVSAPVQATAGYPADSTITASTVPSIVRNYVGLIQDAPLGAQTFAVEYTRTLQVGQDVFIRNPLDDSIQELGAITAIDPILRTVTVARPLLKAFPAASLLVRKEANALAIRPKHAALASDGALNATILSLLDAAPFKVGDAVYIRNIATGARQDLGAVTAVVGNQVTVTNPLTAVYGAEVSTLFIVGTVSDDYAHVHQLDMVVQPVSAFAWLDNVAGNGSAGSLSIQVADASGFRAGYEAMLVDMDDEEYETVIIAGIAGNTITLQTPLQSNYTLGWSYLTGIREEVRALVVDDAGVREVPLDPTRQDAPVFEMDQAQYRIALNDVNWDYLVDWRYPQLSTYESQQRKDTLTAWRADSRFAPVSVLRVSPGTGAEDGTPATSRRVRYLIANMNTVPSTQLEARINGTAQRRVHLFEAQWVDNRVTGVPPLGWGIVSADLQYYLYPDPLWSTFPNLPGWTYPLEQPLGLAVD
jgi:hypothetical protein